MLKVNFMKQNPGILKRVQKSEEKKGVNYAKVDGKLFKFLSFLYYVSAIYALIMCAFYVTGMLLLSTESNSVKLYIPKFITVGICCAVLIAAFVLKIKKQFIISSSFTLVSSIYLILFFIPLMDGSITGFLGLPISFYTRHFIPLFLVVVLSIWTTLIALRERFKFSALYRSVEENLYEAFCNSSADVSEEAWKEFLKTYDGQSPTEIFKDIKK